MPTYDYECDACDHAWEMFQKMSDDPIKKCPSCGKKKARRLFGTGAAIVFKGSGFYETDYRSDSYKKGEKAEKKGAEKSKESTSKGSGESGKPKSEKSSDTKSNSGNVKPKPDA